MARGFSGSTDKVATTSSFSFGTSFTCAGWIYNTSGVPHGNFQCVWRNHSGTANTGTDLGIYVGTNVLSPGADNTLIAINQIGQVDQGSGMGFVVTPATWVHVGFVLSGGTITVYGNGVANGTVANSAAANASVTFFGNDAFAQTWLGREADWAFWNAALTVFEMKALAQGIRPNRLRSAALWYPFDGLASPEPDLSGNANNGTLTGTTLAFGPPIAPFTRRWPRNFEQGAAAPAAQFIFTPAIIP